MDCAEHEVLPHRDIPRMHGLQTPSTNPLGRSECRDRAQNQWHLAQRFGHHTRVGAKRLEQNDEWSLNRRLMKHGGLQSLSNAAPTRVSEIQR